MVSLFSAICCRPASYAERVGRELYYTSQRQQNGTISQTCHADHLDASRQDLSQARRPTAAFPATQTAIGTFRAPCLLNEGEPRIASTWIVSNEGQVWDGAVDLGGWTMSLLWIRMA
jgi:hypothetical protein